MRAVLIDDNQAVNFCNQYLLQETNMFEEILVFENGSSAVEYFKGLTVENTPSVIFIDIKMRDYTGFEVLDEVEELEKDFIVEIPTFILTSSKHKRDLEASEKYPMILEYLEKPLGKDQLFSVINTHLKKA